MVLRKRIFGLRMKKFNIKSLSNDQKKTRLRILELSYNSNLSHIGSCLSAIDLIDAVYKIKKPQEKFILSNGHAGIAFYAILEKNGLIKNQQITEKLNIHPDRNPDLEIPVSSGSLGQGLPIAVGMAIANPKKRVFCMISDGECAEGSIWEALRIANEKQVGNLKIIVNYNGWGGYGKISLSLIERFLGFGYEVKKINGHDEKAINRTLKLNSRNKPTIIFAMTCSNQFSFLKGQDAHYSIMTQEKYEEAIRLLKL